MSPGLIDIVKFEPTNHFAFAENVGYGIHFVLRNGLEPSMRLKIQMPTSIKFGSSCTIELFKGTCSVDSSTSLVTITDMITTTLPNGSLIKLSVKSATNPNGSYESGPWSVYSEIKASNGVWYTVDKAESPTSFFAMPGYINSNLDLTSKTTFDTDTTYSFTCETEHNVPRDGMLMIEVPSDVLVTDQVGSTGLTITKFTSTSVTFVLPAGNSKDNKITFNLSGIRNPRSFRPSDNFIISTLDAEGFTIDQGQDTYVVMDKMAHF
jgi:hypothetical protein